MPRRPAAGHRHHPRREGHRDRRALPVTDPDEMARNYPQAPRISGKQAWAFLPLIVSGRPAGCCILSYERPHTFTAGRTRRPHLPGRTDRPGHGPCPPLRRETPARPRPAAGAPAPETAPRRRLGRPPAAPSRQPRHGHRRRPTTSSGWTTTPPRPSSGTCRATAPQRRPSWDRSAPPFTRMPPPAPLPTRSSPAPTGS